MASRVRKLRVEKGLHAGATAELPADSMCIIGSADDCDIQLFDPDIAPRHVALTPNGEAQVLRCMDGRSVLNERNVLTGESCTVEPGDHLRLGESEVVITFEDLSVAVGDDATRHVASNITFASKVIAVCALALVVMIMGGVFASHSPERDPLAEVNAAIAALGAEDSITATVSNDAIVVSGVVTEPHFSELQQTLQEFEYAVLNSTQSSTMLLEQVRSVFRTNAYHAELAYRGNGIVEVLNLDASNPQVQEVAARVRTDVPAIAELEFAEVADSGRRADALAYSIDPDKRLTTIIDGDIAYVATEDGGRYFVGGILPGGFVLKRINEDGIQVDDNGEIRWLQL